MKNCLLSKDWNTPTKRRNLKKRHKSIGKNKMTKKELKEFFGHSFGPSVGGCVTRYWTIDVPQGTTFRSAECTLIGDKNHNLCKILCSDDTPEAQEIVFNMLSMTKGQNIYSYGEDY